jgi:hypothetical protein
MIFSKKQDPESFDALHRANPRLQPGFAQAVDENRGLRDQIVKTASEDPTAVQTDGGSRSVTRAEVGRQGRSVASSRRLRISTAGAVAAVVVVAAILYSTFSDTPLVSPAYAAEAVKKAAADTSVAALSGVIDTELRIDGEAQVRTTFAWNGEDVSLFNRNAPNSELRYVDGLYYETYGYSVPVETGDNVHAEQWVHVTDYDHGGQPAGAETSAVESPNPAAWLAAARTDLAGSGLIELVAGATGFTRTENSDGSATYVGATTVAAIQSLDLGLSGLPAASQPSFKVTDTSTRVDITVTVAVDGLIQQLMLGWTLDQPGEASKWEYVSTYRDLGTAAAIAAPDPAHTVTTDNRFKGEPEGEI